MRRCSFESNSLRDLAVGSLCPPLLGVSSGDTQCWLSLAGPMSVTFGSAVRANTQASENGPGC
jgi:hypothetical protein